MVAGVWETLQGVVDGCEVEEVGGAEVLLVLLWDGDFRRVSCIIYGVELMMV